MKPTLKHSKKSAAKSCRAHSEKHINLACDQMQRLLAQIDTVQVRHQRAVKRNQDNRSRQLAVQLQVLQGMYTMFYQYADLKVGQLVSEMATEGATR